jgi:hypothetical protein
MNHPMEAHPGWIPDLIITHITAHVTFELYAPLVKCAPSQFL